MTQAGEPPAEPVARRAFRSAVREDFRRSSAGQRVALVGVLFWVSYEWGAGNEAVTPWLIARTISATSGAPSVAITALVGFGFTLVQQLISGFTALLGFSMFERTAKASWARLTARLHTVPGRWGDLGIVSRTIFVFGLGTTAVVLVETVASGSVEARQHRKVVVQSASLCASVVGVIAAGAAVLAIVGRDVEALRGATDLILRVLGNPLLWIGLVVVVGLVHYVQSERGQRESAPPAD